MTSITIQNKTFAELKRIEFNNETNEVKVITKDDTERTFHFKELNASYFGPKRKSVQKTKDPNMPKRPKNPYMLFCLEKRSEVQIELGTKKVGDVQKRLGEIWSSMKDEEKEPYVKKSEILSEEYKKAMENYESSTPGDKTTTKGIVKTAKLTPVNDETAKELPVAPSGWTGPYVGFLKGCPKTNENKRFQKSFDTFEEAVMKMEEFSANQVGGIVKTTKGYCLRSGKKIIQTPGSTTKNEYCWLVTPVVETESKPENSDNTKTTDNTTPTEMVTKKKAKKKLKKKVSISNEPDTTE